MKYKYLIYLLVFSLSGFSQSESLKSVLKTVYNFEKKEDYLSAKSVLLDFCKDKNNASSEVNFAKNYLLFCDYLMSDYSSIALVDQAIKPILNLKNRKWYETELMLKLFTNKFHHLGRNDSWEQAAIIAEQGYQLKDFKQVPPDLQVKYLFDLGDIYRSCSNPYKSIGFINKAIILKINLYGENNAEIADAYNLLGNAYIENYNPSKGNDCYKKAISILEKINDNKAENIDILLEGYRSLIRNLLEYGSISDAEKYKIKVNTIFAKQKLKLKSFSKELYLHSRQMQVHSNVIYYAASKNYDIATLYCDSLKLETNFNLKNIEDIKFVSNRYYDVADYIYEAEDYELTIKKLHELELIINKYNLEYLKMLVNAKLGTSYEKVKNFKKALLCINFADKIVDQENFNSSKFSIQIIKAIILVQLNKNQEAINISKKTLEQLVFEKTKTNISIEKIKFENVQELADTYFINIFEKVAEIYLSEYKKSNHLKDIQIADNLYKISGRLFQEYYLKGEFNDYLSYYHQRIVDGVFECMLLKNANLEQKIESMNLVESNSSQHLLKEFDKKIKRTSTVNNIYLNQVNSLKTELEYYKKLKTKLPKEIITNRNEVISIQKQIDYLEIKISKTEKNYANFNSKNFNIKEVLSLLNDGEQLVKYYVSNTHVYAALLTKNNIEIKKIGAKDAVEKQVKNYVSQVNNAQRIFDPTISKLHTILLPFTLNKKLTIIPDSFINYIPFETLYNQKSKQYVVQNHFVSYTYSLPMWLINQKTKTQKTSQTLAAFTPYYETTSQNNKRSDFKDLKYAGLESQSIVALFNGTLFAKSTATKANFINQIPNFNIFHLSMHAQLYENDFNKSCLVFSGNDKLLFSDLYGMDIPASMVVLSACDTGNGALKSGEGIMSMSRALTYAGVKSAVVSLWPVPDKETSEIMISFYKNLKEGQAKDEALANAKKLFIKNNPLKSHPFYWAGFIVNGDVSPIVTSGFVWQIALACVALLALIFYIFRKKLINFFK